jgi:excisionase family DNA binding protein
MTPKKKSRPYQRRRYEGELLDIAALAAGYGSSEKSWRARIARKQIPHLRLGGRVLVRRAALDAYLAALEVAAS